ncbi:NAD(P)H-dependent oxidoreductase [Photobacterium sanctipauli]|uniref:NAD(P)H-dependent oxidoreductase n=1 Tax=Photobacterium sanctipauli TaxID=1342794 RepID=A0A2T3NUD6_9GAMM|nr:NAD(P)H-dependent oxidoreductase [Photobacterium sanctipauli]PSW19849.1 NAD(P)H-dependent oxidoreductase [Photobacterium sanctipauli]
MKVIAFAASSSSTSINKQLVTYAGSLVKGADLEVLDLNDYELPLFSQDKENEIGQPEMAKAFLAKLNSAEAIVISFAEHNGSYTAAYKNLFDWCSRIQQKVYQDKKLVLLSTSPGPGGAKNVLAAASGSAPFFGAEVKATVSIPSFYENFDVENQRISNRELNDKVMTAISALSS